HHDASGGKSQIDDYRPVPSRQARWSWPVKRSIFLASLGLTGCGYHLGNKLNETQWIHNALGIVQPLNHGIIGTRGMARVYKDDDVDRNFRTNGFDPPNTSEYNSWVRDQYRGYKLIVDGLVERPQ